MLCFDPTRGIDIRTKNQIYVLLRDLAEAGAAILLYTSELKEVELVCDRAIVIFGGRIVRELTAEEADEPALLRAAYNLRADSALPEDAAGEVVSRGRRRPPPRPTADCRPPERRAGPDADGPGASRGRLVTAAAGPIDAAGSRPAPTFVAQVREQRVDDRAAPDPDRPARVHEGHPAALRPDPAPGPRRRRSCRSRSPPSRRRSS